MANKSIYPYQEVPKRNYNTDPVFPPTPPASPQIEVFTQPTFTPKTPYKHNKSPGHKLNRSERSSQLSAQLDNNMKELTRKEDEAEMIKKRERYYWCESCQDEHMDTTKNGT